MAVIYQSSEQTVGLNLCLPCSVKDNVSHAYASSVRYRMLQYVSGRTAKHVWCSLAAAAVELPAFLLDAPDVGHGLHSAVVPHTHLGDPLQAGGMAPQPGLSGGLQGTSLNGAQAALGRLGIILNAREQSLPQLNVAHIAYAGHDLCYIWMQRKALQNLRQTGMPLISDFPVCATDNMHPELNFATFKYNSIHPNSLEDNLTKLFFVILLICASIKQQVICIEKGM